MMRTLGFSAMVVFVRKSWYRVGYKVCVVFRRGQVWEWWKAQLVGGDPAQCGEGESEKLLYGRCGGGD